MTTEADRQLTKAAARNPELAAMLAGRHDDPSARYRRLAAMVGVAAVAVGIVWGALGWLPRPRSAPARPHEAAEEIDTSHYLRPLETAAAGPGEEVAPFSGFAVSVDTEPPGALVTIAGVPRGEAPALANVDCAPGTKLEIRAEKEGFAPARAETACRADTLVKLTVRLRP
jgi:hypothetical protein